MAGSEMCSVQYMHMCIERVLISARYCKLETSWLQSTDHTVCSTEYSTPNLWLIHESFPAVDCILWRTFESWNSSNTVYNIQYFSVFYVWHNSVVHCKGLPLDTAIQNHNACTELLCPSHTHDLKVNAVPVSHNKVAYKENTANG